MGEKFDPYYKWLGIPPKDQPPHHYRLLGIELFEQDREVIDAAANRLMGYLKDLAVGDEGAYSQNLLNEIARARLCLLNKKKKPEYDQQLRGQLKAEEARKPAAKGPPPKAPKRSLPPPTAPPSTAAPPSDEGLVIEVLPDETAKSPLGGFVDPGDGKKTRQPVGNETPVRVHRHSRGVYVAATLIAIVGGVGLILIIVMSFLLLTSP